MSKRGGDWFPPVRKIPTLGGLKYVGQSDYHARGVPAKEQEAYWVLAERFRAGEIYSFSWDAERKTWDVWESEADWFATERNGSVRSPELAAAGHGPRTFAKAVAKATKTAKATKADLVGLLRRVVDGTDWSVAELEDLLARA
jgi:hypothetical protein